MPTTSIIAQTRFAGMHITERQFTVPLDHRRPQQGDISLFAREVVAAEKSGQDLPWLVFFSGGPGFAAPRPSGRSGWIKRALQDHRVLLLDTRGNGRSTPVLTASLVALGSPAAQAAYLKHFRADSIVADAECIRSLLTGGKPWSILGQSYGGFCAIRYLSASPEGLAAAYITGGIPPIGFSADDYYRENYPEVKRKNQRYFTRYPGDQQRCRDIATQLAASDVRLPTGGRLSVERFQQLGLGLGMGDGHETMHHLVELAFCPGTTGLTLPFLRGVENQQAYETNPIFAILHEMCYTEGYASRWSAQRVRGEFPEFDWKPGSGFLFTGEMIYPWMFDQYEQLRPLQAAAELLAADADWPPLYDLDRLAANRVPCAAAIYAEDMYVPRRLSEASAAKVAGLRRWLTNEYEHSGIRDDGERVLDRLITLARE